MIIELFKDKYVFFKLSNEGVRLLMYDKCVLRSSFGRAEHNVLSFKDISPPKTLAAQNVQPDSYGNYYTG